MSERTDPKVAAATEEIARMTLPAAITRFASETFGVCSDNAPVLGSGV